MQVVIPNNPGQGHVRPVPAGQAITNDTTTRTSFVSTMTLDYLAQHQGWLDDDSSQQGVSIVLLKLDVEGAEPFVIQGAKRLLTQRVVQNVLLEFRRPQHHETQQSVAILLDAGYLIVNDEIAGAGPVRLDWNKT